MNVRKLIARLNPPIKPLPTDTGRSVHKGHSRSLVQALARAGKYELPVVEAGGTACPGDPAYRAQILRTPGTATRGGPSADAITAIDIAHALATIKDPLAREIFCHLWWPEGAAREFEALRVNLRNAMYREYARRNQLRVDAAMEVELARLGMVRWKAEDRARLRRAERDRERALAAKFPKRFDRYPAVVDAVLEELAAPNHCAVCDGRGIVWHGELQVDCSTCEASGTLPVSDRQRAEGIGCKLSTYQQAWRHAYEWVFRLAWKAEGSAAAQMRRFLLDDTSARAA